MIVATVGRTLHNNLCKDDNQIGASRFHPHRTATPRGLGRELQHHHSRAKARGESDDTVATEESDSDEEEKEKGEVGNEDETKKLVAGLTSVRTE